MAKDDGMGEKTEDATPKRREEAREKGQVAKSQDLTGAVTMLLGFATLKGLGGYFGNEFGAYFRIPFANLDKEIGTLADHVSMGTDAYFGILFTLAPLLGALFIAGALVTIIQVGIGFAPKAFELNWGKMNPITGFGKLFSKRSVVKLLLGLLKITIVGSVIYIVLSGEFDSAINFMSIFDYTHKFNVARLVFYLWDWICWLGIYAGGTLTIIGAIDFAYQKYQHSEDLKMSKQEVKEEMKNMEGDPMIKRRRLERARQMAQKRMQGAVPEADVVVTNPTHYSVAIRYMDKDPAPRVVAKGQDHMALKIREIASEARVPIVEKPELARALYRYVEIDELVPDSHWAAVAEVLAYVYGIDERRRKRAGVSG